MTSGVLVVSFSSMKPEEIIKNILKTQVLPEPEIRFDNIKCFPWHLETKYYTTDLFFCSNELKDVCPEFLECIEAIVVHFDATQESSFEDVIKCLPILKSYNADIQILVCDNCTNYGNETSNKYLLWCIKNKFELVELYPQNNEDDDYDDSEKTDNEKTGYKRIIEALQAHIWPDLQMKEKVTNSLNPYCHQQSSLSNEEKHSLEKESKINKDLSQTERIDILMNTDEEYLQHLDSKDSPCFEELFQKFSAMKETARNLFGEERKRYAEKVTLAFWNALGGDDDEIEGISSEDD